MVQIGKKRLVVRSHLDLLCWSLQSSKDGDCTTSLGNLLCCLTALLGKDFFLKPLCVFPLVLPLPCNTDPSSVS